MVPSPSRLSLFSCFIPLFMAIFGFPLLADEVPPTIFHHQKLSHDQFGDTFGAAVAASGRRATASNSLHFRQHLFWDDNAEQWALGDNLYQETRAVSIDSSRWLGPLDRGAYTYLWSDDDGEYTYERAVTVNTDAPASLALFGDHAALGFPEESVGGVVRLYHFDGQSWQYVAVFGGVGGEEFGYSIDLFGNLLAVGSPRPGSGATGEVNLYEYAEDDQWHFRTTLTSPSQEADNEFGHSVAIQRTWIAVGSPKEDSGIPSFTTDSGAVFLFRRTDTSTWLLGKIFRGGTDFDLFGSSLDLEDNTLAVGAPFEDTDSQFPLMDLGVAYVYWRSGESWRTVARLVAGDGTSNDQLGTSVAISRTGVLAGAPHAEGTSGELNAGAVYFWNDLHPLFEDGFESGDTSAWSEAST